MGYRNACAVVMVAALVCPLSLFAHPALENYLQQRVTAVVSPENIDITLEWTFTTPASLAERRRMDSDGDGRISKAEQHAYLESIAKNAEKALQLAVNGSLQDLIPLYDPELDFLDSKDFDAHPHQLRLFYFVRTPQGFHPGSTVTLDSGLWADAPSMIAVTVRGEGGIHMASSPTDSLRRPPGGSKVTRVLKATCKILPISESLARPKKTRSE